MDGFGVEVEDLSCGECGSRDEICLSGGKLGGNGNPDIHSSSHHAVLSKPGVLSNIKVTYIQK